MKNLKQQRWLLIGLFISVLIAQTDTNIIYIALPAITRYFGISLSTASWLIIFYHLIIGGSALIIGKLGDDFSVKRLYLSGLLAFIFGLIACSFSGNIYLLIFSRCFVAFGTGIISVLTPIIIVSYFPSRKVGSVFGIRSVAANIGIGIGAPLGGILVHFFNWKWIFIINIPGAIIAFSILTIMLPLDRPKFKISESKNFDFLGSVLSAVCILSFLYALNMGKEHGWSSGIIWISLSISLISIVIFSFHERKIQYPLINPELFQSFFFVITSASIFLIFMVIAGINFLLPYYLIDILGLTERDAGIAMLVFCGTSIISAFIVGKLIDKKKTFHIYLSSMLLMTFLYIYFYFIGCEDSLIWILIFLFLMGIINPIFLTTYIPNILNYAKQENKSQISGIAKTIVRISMATGICIFETVFMEALPKSLTKADIDSLNTIPTKFLDMGFELVAILAIGCCLTALILNLRKIYFSA